MSDRQVYIREDDELAGEPVFPEGWSCVWRAYLSEASLHRTLTDCVVAPVLIVRNPKRSPSGAVVGTWVVALALALPRTLATVYQTIHLGRSVDGALRCTGALAAHYRSGLPVLVASGADPLRAAAEALCPYTPHVVRLTPVTPAEGPPVGGREGVHSPRAHDSPRHRT